MYCLQALQEQVPFVLIQNSGEMESSSRREFLASRRTAEVRSMVSKASKNGYRGMSRKMSSGFIHVPAKEFSTGTFVFEDLLQRLQEPSNCIRTSIVAVSKHYHHDVAGC